MKFMKEKKKQQETSKNRRARSGCGIADNATTASTSTLSAILNNTLKHRHFSNKMVSETSVAPLTLDAPSANYSCLIRLDDFERYAVDALWAKDDGELQRQFNLFCQGRTKQAEYGIKPENMPKNKNTSIIPYDHNRVILKKLPNIEFSDYINASYIEGNGKPNAYIATQHPKGNTAEDFWRMVWQENVDTIIMIDEVLPKIQNSFQYWPNLNVTRKYGTMTLLQNKVKRFGGYILRTLLLERDNDQRLITQLHFTSWPEREVPSQPQNLVAFLKRISMIDSSAPVVIHSNNGVGRTGTIMLCSMVLKMARQRFELDFLAILQQLREQRQNMVANIKQYKLAHLLVYEILFGQETTIPCGNYFSEIVQRLLQNEDNLEKEMDYINNMYWADQVMYYSLRSRSERSSIKQHSDSVFSQTEIDGFNCPAKYTIMQQPLRNLSLELWKMVINKDFAVIVYVNDIQSKTEYMLWPTKVNSKMKITKNLSLKCLDQNEYSNRNVSIINLSYMDEEQKKCKKTITIINMKGWPDSGITSQTSHSLLAAWQEMDKVSGFQNRILVTCRDGETASGVFVALCYLIDKMTDENQCDVCFAARMVRLASKKFIRQKEHLELLYRAAIQYLEEYMVYVEID